MKIVKRFLVTIAILLAVIVLVLVGYIIYLQTGYYRYEDNIDLPIKNQSSGKMTLDGKYEALSYNIGFGAYDQEYSFFMDTGVMKSGEEVSGKFGKGASFENVLHNTEQSALLAANLENVDFYLFQEADIDASRSYKIDQTEIIGSKLPNYSQVFASNFHSRYLFYPFTDPHGYVEAGLLTLSKYEIEQATRKSYTVDEGFFIKFFDLDRCFSVHRYEIENSDKEFVLINNHMSAYDEGGKIRKKQIAELFDFANTEYEKGNYVIIGGDFNHALSGSEYLYETQQEFPSWVSIFPEDELPNGFSIVKPDNIGLVASCRTADIPYEKGVNYETIVDGFMVSGNINASATIIDAQYKYSDHNPVHLKFSFN